MIKKRYTVPTTEQFFIKSESYLASSDNIGVSNIENVDESSKCPEMRSWGERGSFWD